VKSFGQFVGNKNYLCICTLFKISKGTFLYLKITRFLFPVTDKSCEGKKISVCFKSRAAYLKANNAATSVFIEVFNQLVAQNLFNNKFYSMPLHVSNTCARNM